MRKVSGIAVGLLCSVLAGMALAVPAASALTASDFADWTSVNDVVGPDTATGTLHGTSISLTGNVFPVNSFDSNTSGTYTGFNSSAFTPSLAASDVVAIGTSGSPFTLQLGSAVTNPVLHVAALGTPFGTSTLRFPPGTQITKLSGNITVSGREVGHSTPDANGTVRLDGSFSSTSFEARCAAFDPMGGCGESMFLHVGAEAPPAPPPADSPPPAASGSSCPAGNSAGVSCQNGGTTVTGTPGNDKIVAPAGAKVVNGGGGNDTIDCRTSKATCQGGAGKDQLTCNASQARCDGGTGNDKLDCKQTKGACAGGSGADNVNCQKAQSKSVCAGGAGDDKVVCKETKGRCDGGTGADNVNCQKAQSKSVCAGGTGNDKLDCKQTKGACAGGSGADNVSCQKAQSKSGCAGDAGPDTLNCSDAAAKSKCAGGSGNDKLICEDPKSKACAGGSGKDRISEQRPG